MDRAGDAGDCPAIQADGVRLERKGSPEDVSGCAQAIYGPRRMGSLVAKAAETQRQCPTDLPRSQSPVIPPSFWDDNEMFCVLHDDELYALDLLGFQPRQPADFCPAKRLSE